MCAHAHTHTHTHTQLLFSPLLAKLRLSMMLTGYGLMAGSISKAAPQRFPSVISRAFEHRETALLDYAGLYGTSRPLESGSYFLCPSTPGPGTRLFIEWSQGNGWPPDSQYGVESLWGKVCSGAPAWKPCGQSTQCSGLQRLLGRC